MKSIKLGIIIFVAFLVVGCGGNDSKQFSVFQIKDGTKIEDIIKALGEQTRIEDDYYYWDDFELLKDFPGELEAKEDSNGELFVFRWTSNEESEEKYKELMEAFKRQYKDAWVELSDGNQYMFFYDKDPEDGRAIHAGLIDSHTVITAPDYANYDNYKK